MEVGVSEKSISARGGGGGGGGLFGEKEVEDGTFECFGNGIYFVDGGVALDVTGY